MAKVTGYFPTAEAPRLKSKYWHGQKSTVAAIYAEFQAPDFSRRRKLRRELVPIVRRYRSMRATWTTTPDKTTLKDWLRAVQNASTDLAELMKTGTGTGLTIVSENAPWGRLEADMLVVAHRAECALLKLPARHGREIDAPFNNFVRDIAGLYQNWLGEWPGLSRHPVTGTFGGPFFRLMRALFQWMEMTDPRKDEAFGRALERALNGQKEL